MPYQHGVKVTEAATGVLAPITGTAGLQVVIGTAPVNLADDPYHAANTPIIAYSWAEAVSKLGYSDDYSKYTLCASMYAAFKLFGVAPVIFINVLDPSKTEHKTNNTAQTVTVTNMEATVNTPGILLDTVTVATVGESTATLTKDTDYSIAFNDEGKVVITLTATGRAAAATSLSVTSTSINPAAVTSDDIIGTSSGGTEKGMEVIRQVYPRLGMTPGLLLAPGWSHISDVGIALAAKCENINGCFRCEALVDIDSRSSGCTVYDSVKTAKENAGCSSPHVMALWPCVAAGSQKLWFSAVMGALIAYTDAANDDVPNLSPSNKLIGITGTVLADATYTDGAGWDKEVYLDQLQANAVNGAGVTTALNLNGWRSWGNNSAAYPASTDPKDRWFCCRRFFSWWGNSFILTYAQRVDNPANRRLIEAIVDSENIRGNAYVAQGKCAVARIEFIADENPVTELLNGNLKFHQYLSPYPPAENIQNTLEFDPDALASALNGG